MNIYSIICEGDVSETLDALKDEKLIVLFTKLINVIEDLEDRVRSLENSKESDNYYE